MKKDPGGILLIMTGLAFVVVGYLNGNMAFCGVAMMFIILGLDFPVKNKVTQSRK